MTCIARDGIGPGGIAYVTAARTTLTDVAVAAGVSPSTASRVLHGGAGVSPALVSRVQAAAAALGYSVNQQARSLRRGRDMAIGLVVEDFRIPFFGHVATVAEGIARGHGQGVVIACSGTATSEVAAVRSLLSRNVAGLMVAGGTGMAPPGYLSQVAETIPLVIFDTTGPDPVADTVTVDNVEGGRLATAQLLAQGHREVLFVGSGRAATTVAARRVGYLRALQDAGVPAREELTLWAGFLTPDVRVAVQQALQEHPEVTAVFSSGARTTPGVLTAVADLGRRELAFCGMDEVAGAEAFQPPLTVVRQDIDAIAEIATTLLFERVLGYDGPPKHVDVPLSLIVRGSAEVAPPAVHRTA